MLLLIFIVKYTKGNKGLKDVFRPMLKWKVHPKWYLFGLLFALSIGFLTLLLKAFYYEGDYTSAFKIYFSNTSLRASFALLTWAFCGEVVWVSYAVRELSKVTKPFYASQVIGFFWSLWWVPLYIINDDVIAHLPYWALFVNMMGAAGMCLIVYEKTKSGICVWILQWMLNMSLILLPVSVTLGGVPTYVTFALLYYVTMLVFMYFRNPIKKINTIKV